MRPEMCKNCCAREFVEREDAYICAYCDTRYPRWVITAPKSVPVPRPPEPYPVSRQERKPKNKWLAFFLCFFLGFYGFHKFYEGKIGMGVLYFFTAGLFGIGWLVDCIILLSKPNPYYV